MEEDFVPPPDETLAPEGGLDRLVSNDERRTILNSFRLFMNNETQREESKEEVVGESEGIAANVDDNQEAQGDAGRRQLRLSERNNASCNAMVVSSLR